MLIKVLSTGANASGFSLMVTANGKKCLVNAGDRYHYNLLKIIYQLFSFLTYLL